MEEAIREADTGISASEGGPFGCVIVKDGRIVGKGHNMVVRKKDPTCHGEMMAIRDAAKNLDSFDLSGCELYTTGEPCPMCHGAILWANIRKVYYGCSLEDTDHIGFRDVEFSKEDYKNSAFSEQLDREACLELYDRYRRIADKTMY